MELNVTFRHMDHTEALDSAIKTKAEKFNKWLHGSGNIQWTCFKENTTFTSEVKIHHERKDYFAKASDGDMYKTFDLVIDKLQHQIQKK